MVIAFVNLRNNVAEIYMIEIESSYFMVLIGLPQTKPFIKIFLPLKVDFPASFIKTGFQLAKYECGSN